MIVRVDVLFSFKSCLSSITSVYRFLVVLSNGNIEWQFYGRDIFVTIDGLDDFRIDGDIIISKDFQGYCYKINLNGKEI